MDPRSEALCIIRINCLHLKRGCACEGAQICEMSAVVRLHVRGKLRRLCTRSASSVAASATAVYSGTPQGASEHLLPYQRSHASMKREEPQAMVVVSTDAERHAAPAKEERERIFMCITLETFSPRMRVGILTVGIVVFYLAYFLITVRQLLTETRRTHSNCRRWYSGTRVSRYRVWPTLLKRASSCSSTQLFSLCTVWRLRNLHGESLLRHSGLRRGGL